MDAARHDRLRQDLASLEQLKDGSSIFDFDVVGEPPERYTLIFRGVGLQRGSSSRDAVSVIKEHQVDLRLPYSYPRRPPDIRWLTPIFHPNVSFSGFIHLRDLGLPWSSEVTLDVVCERLWDTARCAFINDEKATNYSANKWFREQSEFSLPIDVRPLRDRIDRTRQARNVVRYKRRDGKPQLAASEVFFIGEDTPVPELPSAVRIPRRGPAARSGDDDVLYIGDE